MPVKKSQALKHLALEAKYASAAVPGRQAGGRQANGNNAFLQDGNQLQPPLCDQNRLFLGGAVGNTIWFLKEELSELTQVFSMVGYPV